MSELEIKKSEALEAISAIVRDTKKNPIVAVHEVNILALGIEDDVLENGGSVAVHIMSQGRGKPKLRQRFYEIKVQTLADILGDLLENIERPEDKIVDEVLPSYLTEDTYPSEEEDNA